jgi:hypothetical protein
LDAAVTCISVLAVHRPELQNIVTAQAGDGSGDVSPAARALAKLASNLGREFGACRERHALQGRGNFLLGKDIQERRLLQGNGQRGFQGAIEDGVARAIGEVGENNRIFVIEAANLPGAVVKASGDSSS